MEFLYFSFYQFLLVWVRILGLFLTAPVFNSRIIPTLAKIGFSFLLSVVIFPAVNTSQVVVQETGTYVLSLMAELLLGIALGFVTNLVFSAIQIAGEIIDFQMGFSYVNVVDPLSNLGSSVMGQFYLMVALLYYLGTGGHYLTLQGIAHSFQTIPLGKFTLEAEMFPSFLVLLREVMIIALQLGAPVIVALFLANFTLAIISRAIPQMNVFIVGLPLNVGVGFFMSLMTLPYLFPFLERIVELFLRGFFRVFVLP
ncbi:MAG: flagellar type III secretion system protein FliR [Candidatus Atribacteria bacterium]|nr:flagellar type III secretion system protein FliR [Candidatus Atribacteria bacterium]